MPFHAHLQRANRVLDDQVRIWIGQDPAGDAAACLTLFRGGFALVALMAADHRVLASEDDDEEHISCFRPATWQSKLVAPTPSDQ